jgi:hypothetical protein
MLAACSKIPDSAYINRGDPENLLDVSSEIVSLDISSDTSVQALIEWMDKDAPTRAELYCITGDNQCDQAVKALQLYRVPYLQMPSNERIAVFVYERVLARDCNNRYMDNSINPYHLNHPSFGCSVSANIAQHVTDKKQFIRPELLGLMDADKAIQSVEKYKEASDIRPITSVSEGLVSSSQN